MEIDYKRTKQALRWIFDEKEIHTAGSPARIPPGDILNIMDTTWKDIGLKATDSDTLNS